MAQDMAAPAGARLRLTTPRFRIRPLKSQGSPGYSPALGLSPLFGRFAAGCCFWLFHRRPGTIISRKRSALKEPGK